MLCLLDGGLQQTMSGYQTEKPGQKKNYPRIPVITSGATSALIADAWQCFSLELRALLKEGTPVLLGDASLSLEQTVHKLCVVSRMSPSFSSRHISALTES